MALFGGKPPKVVKVSSYWDHSGQFQTLQDEMFKQLVPSSGKCPTVEGELLRAASKIYYDYYNNGFGNNWSGAWNFLDSFTGSIPIRAELSVLYPYRCGLGGLAGGGSRIEKALESLVDKVILYISEKNGSYTENTADMYDLSEKDSWDPRFGLDEDEGIDNGEEFYSSLSPRTAKLKKFADLIRKSNESPLRAVRQMLTEAARRIENLRSSGEGAFQPHELDALIKTEALIEKGRQILFDAQTEPPKKPKTPEAPEQAPAVKTPEPAAPAPAQ